MKAYATVAVIAFLALVSVGLFIAGSPKEAQEYDMDNQRVYRLQHVQSALFAYYDEHDDLPASLEQEDIQDALRSYGVYAPVDPETGDPLQYTRQDEDSFTLCATFYHDSHEQIGLREPYYYGGPVSDKRFAPHDWDHDAGDVCFEREILENK